MKKNLLNINEEEKNRILEMHTKAIKNHYLNEQGVANPVKPINTANLPNPTASSNPILIATQKLSKTPISTWLNKEIGLIKTVSTDPNYTGEIRKVVKVGEIHSTDGGMYGTTILILDNGLQISVVRQKGVGILKFTDPKSRTSYQTDMLDKTFKYFA